MSELSITEISPEQLDIEIPDISHIITEDDEPVDNIFSEKQQRLLTRSLNASWKPGHPFLTAANVGIFYGLYKTPIVPDVFLSLNVISAEDIWEKKNRSYLLWEFGKPPEVAVEIVSNKKGGETDKKLEIYSRVGVRYYIVFDPQLAIQKDSLRIYELVKGQYIPKIDRQLQRVGIGVTLWKGVFEDRYDCWLRWCDQEGNFIKTGEESTDQERQRAEQERQRADQERQRADQERQRANQERQRAEQEKQNAEQERQRADALAAKLRALGIDSDSIA
ncbi:Uma2 family endonuclease [Desulfobacterales bacterium HSG16]|nr:Uma2 family endonuclease [Desulfobacterales bacterium HSG16]